MKTPRSFLRGVDTEQQDHYKVSSFLGKRSAFFFDDLNHVRDLADHAANGRCVFQFTHTVHFVQTQTNQRSALVGGAADWRANLLDYDRLSQAYASSATCADDSTLSSRLGRMSATFLPRR